MATNLQNIEALRMVCRNRALPQRGIQATKKAQLFAKRKSEAY